MRISVKPLTEVQQSLICQAAMKSDDDHLRALSPEERKVVAAAFKGMENLWNKKHISFDNYIITSNVEEKKEIEGLLNKLNKNTAITKKQNQSTSIFSLIPALLSRIRGDSSNALIQKRQKLESFLSSKQSIESQIAQKQNELIKLMNKNEVQRNTPEVLLEDFFKGLNHSKKGTFFSKRSTTSLSRSIELIDKKTNHLTAVLIKELDSRFKDKQIEEIKEKIQKDRLTAGSDADNFIVNQLKQMVGLKPHQEGLKSSILFLFEVKREIEAHLETEIDRVMKPYKEIIDLKKLKKDFVDQIVSGNEKKATQLLDSEIKRVENKIKKSNKKATRLLDSEIKRVENKIKESNKKAIDFKGEGGRSVIFLYNTVEVLKQIRKIPSPLQLLKSKADGILTETKNSHKKTAKNDKSIARLTREIEKLNNRLQRIKL